MKETRDWLQKEFEHFEAEPPVDLWPEIEARMKQENVGRKKWLPYFSIAASILVLLGLFWSLQKFERELESPIVQQIEADNYIQETETPIVPETEVVENQIAVEEIKPLESQESLKEEVLIEKEDKTMIEPNIATQVANNMNEVLENDKKELVVVENATPEKPESELIIENIESLPEYTAISQIESLDNHIISEIDHLETKKATDIKRVGSTNRLDLNDLTLENAVVFATNGINRIVNTPLEIQHEESAGETVKTYSFRLKNFSITKKQHTKTIKTDKS